MHQVVLNQYAMQCSCCNDQVLVTVTSGMLQHAKGRRHSGRNDDETEDEDDDNHSQLNFGCRHHRRGNHEQRFGKLKFTMPKFAAEPSMRNFSGRSKSISNLLLNRPR